MSASAAPTIVLVPIASARIEHACVFVSDGDYGMHVGIAYVRQKQVRLIHLAWHHLMVVEAAKTTRQKDCKAVVPAVDPLRLKVLAGLCELRASLKQKIPYGFRYQGSVFAKDGSFVPGSGELGLTCATFVLALFEWARIKLIDANAWPVRTEDKAFWNDVLNRLADPRYNVALDHLKALNAETLSRRFRAEEVAASSALTPQPVAFSVAESAGARLFEDFFAGPAEASGP